MGLTRRSAAVDDRRKSMLAWQDRFRDPALTVLLVMELCLVFLAGPLPAEQVPLAEPIVQTMVLVVAGSSLYARKGGYRTVSSCHHGRSPRDARNGTPEPLTSNCKPDVGAV
jgi:hypothetical protein